MKIKRGDKLKYGTKNIIDLTEKQKDNLLNEILDNCVKYAGDSYEDFARPVIKLLVKKKLADYGD